MKKLKILFISNWGINEGLSEATTYPHLKLLESFDRVESIYYITIERNEFNNPFIKNPKITHYPFLSGVSTQDKVLEYFKFYKFCNSIVSKKNINRIIARGASAGIYACRIHVKTKIPFDVESFEPHADYMYESGTWGKYNLKYLLQKYWERQQIKLAENISTVTNCYSQILKHSNPQKAIFTIPCSANFHQFKFNSTDRIRIRQEFNIASGTTIGIYVGKFGGLYHHKKAFHVFKQFLEISENNHLFVLNPNPSEVQNLFSKFGITSRFTITTVLHSQVPNYLSASDFAFSLIKSTPSKVGMSPIKNAEYWANGLPIISTDNIGDDSNYIKVNANAGSIIQPEKGFTKELNLQIQKLISINSNRTDNHCTKAFFNLRLPQQSETIYNKLYS